MKSSPPAALLAIPLATTFGAAVAPPTEAQTVTYDLTIEPELNIADSYLFFVTSSPIGATQLGAFEAGQRTEIENIANPFPSDPPVTVFLGLYEIPASDDLGLSLSLVNPGDPANRVDLSFEAFFNENFDPTGPDAIGNATFAEDPVIAQLQNGGVTPGNSAVDPDTPVDAFLRGFAFPSSFGGGALAPTIGFDTSLDVGISNFTSLTSGGTLIAEFTVNGTVIPVPQVPEPASLALLASGALLITARRRR